MADKHYKMKVTLTDGTEFDAGVITVPQGPAGAPGPAGADGTTGASAYEIAVENGFKGTEAEWLESLKGADGAPGPQGETGPAGAPGPAGDPGLTAEQIQMFQYLAQHMTVDKETGKVTFSLEIEAPSFNAVTEE